MKGLTSRQKIYISTFFAIISSQVRAQSFFVPDPNTLMGSRSAGRSNATVAAELDHDSLLQNPAASVFKSQYAVSIEYGVVGDGLAASIVDTQSGPVGGGVYYSRRDFEGVDMSQVESIYGNFQRIEEQAGFALMGRFSEQFGVGGTVKWSYIKSFEGGVPSGRAWTFDLGSRIKINNMFSVGILGQNLLKDDRGYIPRRLSAGFEVTPSIGLSLNAEINSVEARSLVGNFALPNSSSTVGWALGTQYLFAQGPVLRAGYQNAPAWDRSSFSLGAGFQNKSFSIDYAFQKSLKNQSALAHQLGFSGYF